MDDRPPRPGAVALISEPYSHVKPSAFSATALSASVAPTSTRLEVLLEGSRSTSCARTGKAATHHQRPSLIWSHGSDEQMFGAK
jgi:hypothetical protein